MSKTPRSDATRNGLHALMDISVKANEFERLSDQLETELTEAKAELAKRDAAMSAADNGLPKMPACTDCPNENIDTVKTSCCWPDCRGTIDEWARHADILSATIAKRDAALAEVEKKLPVEPRRQDQCGIHFQHQPHDYCNGSAAALIPDEELISRGYVDSLRQFALAQTATISAQEVTIAELKGDAERYSARKQDEAWSLRRGLPEGHSMHWDSIYQSYDAHSDFLIKKYSTQDSAHATGGSEGGKT